MEPHIELLQPTWPLSHTRSPSLVFSKFLRISSQLSKVRMLNTHLHDPTPFQQNLQDPHRTPGPSWLVDQQFFPPTQAVTGLFDVLSCEVPHCREPVSWPGPLPPQGRLSGSKPVFTCLTLEYNVPVPILPPWMPHSTPCSDTHSTERSSPPNPGCCAGLLAGMGPKAHGAHGLPTPGMHRIELGTDSCLSNAKAELS